MHANSRRSTTTTLPLLSCTPCVAPCSLPLSPASVVDVYGFTLGVNILGGFSGPQIKVSPSKPANATSGRDGLTPTSVQHLPRTHHYRNKSGPVPVIHGRTDVHIIASQRRSEGGERVEGLRIKGGYPRWLSHLRDPCGCSAFRTHKQSACLRDLSVSLSCAHEICCTIGWNESIGECCWRPFFSSATLQDDTLCVKYSQHGCRPTATGGAIDGGGPGQLSKAAPRDLIITQPSRPNQPATNGGVMAA